MHSHPSVHPFSRCHTAPDIVSVRDEPLHAVPLLLVDPPVTHQQHHQHQQQQPPSSPSPPSISMSIASINASSGAADEPSEGEGVRRPLSFFAGQIHFVNWMVMHFYKEAQVRQTEREGEKGTCVIC